MATTVGTTVKFGGETLNCIVSDFSVERTREVKERTCITSGDVKKSLGASKISDLTFQVVKDDAATGNAQKIVRDAYEAGTSLAFVLEDSDMPQGGTNGSQMSFSCYVIKDVISYPEDDDLQFEFTITVDGAYTITPAA